MWCSVVNDMIVMVVVVMNSVCIVLLVLSIRLVSSGLVVRFVLIMKLSVVMRWFDVLICVIVVRMNGSMKVYVNLNVKIVVL